MPKFLFKYKKINSLYLIFLLFLFHKTNNIYFQLYMQFLLRSMKILISIFRIKKINYELSS